MSQFFGTLCGLALPLFAMFLAMADSQFRVDGTVTIGNIFTGISFIIGGILAIAAIPRQVKNMGIWIREHDAWSKKQTDVFTEQIAQLVTLNEKLTVLIAQSEKRLDSLEHRFNNHVENGGHQR